MIVSNKEIAQTILSQIESFGYKPYDVTYGDGYFIFNMGDHSVVHFRLKGVWRHWKFGMWIQSKYLSSSDPVSDNSQPYERIPKVVQVFCQYDTQIDKFKPSRSDLLWELTANQYKEIGQYPYLLAGLKRMLDMVRRHPLLCYNGLCGSTYHYYSDQSFLLEFIKEETAEYFQKLRHAFAYAWCVPYTYTKCWLAQKAKCVHHIEVHNFEKENPGFRTNHLLEVNIFFSEHSSEEQERKWLSFWFKKGSYGKFDYYDYITRVMPFFKKIGMEEEFVFDPPVW